MTDDQQRARELLADAYERHGHAAKAAACRSGRNDLIRSEHAIEAITAALRAAPESVALRTAMETLEQIATAPDDKGAKFNAASCVAFLTTQGAVGASERLDERVLLSLATGWRRHAANGGRGRTALIQCAESLEAAVIAARPQEGETQ